MPENARMVSREEKGKATLPGDVNYLDRHSMDTLLGERELFKLKSKGVTESSSWRGLNVDWELPLSLSGQGSQQRLFPLGIKDNLKLDTPIPISQAQSNGSSVSWQLHKFSVINVGDPWSLNGQKVC